MKNIHILPTDNYAPLVHSTNKYGGYFKSEHYSPMKEMGDSYQHIYITSDEEIKFNEYVIQVNFEKTNTQVIRCTTEFQVKIANDEDGSFTKKKIILTTDPDLIKNGVQAIDDEFLEWFVKNPSCESVEIDKNWNYPLDKSWEYKIIIPKEEPFIEYTNTNDCTSMIYNPKEETLEEDLLNTAIQVVGDNNITTIKEFLVKHKWQAENYGLMEIELRHTKTLLASCEKALDERDKQQERMYSEEEVFNLCREFAIFVQRNGPSYKKQQEWFEQFKKK